ncbi:MAG: hypothetical protein IRZ14_08995 [Chloroflexi bacterium]|nr:hypothetical protein [Chloroflexota bacterium]
MENFELDQAFDIVELEPRQAASPDACFTVVCTGSGGSGGVGSGSVNINIGIGSGGSGT